ncbi:GAF domain-containing protein [Leifsonia sp. TF02-11]|uniref:GAF domain-containing protein n=1 Tax=Leifsonia sp. TF02-11 TaxID=2815212 RepID=UPI001AA0C026|nr:GAF domain-containing protein [Leifsonia sp. TF02-11]MBO1740911.1 GAF domain-containing protein [Leifsonia sp. TF02-11]
MDDGVDAPAGTAPAGSAVAGSHPGLRPVVDASWRRAEQAHLDPAVAAPLVLDGPGLEDARRAHPIAAALPVIRQLLVRDAEPDSRVVVAVGDARGRLLWVEGDPVLRSRAESMLFVPGAAWAEGDVGTSAPGTALAIGDGVQIRGAEHFAEDVKPWSCTAVPVRDPETGDILGVIDVTGGDQVAAPHVLPLLEATAAAVERELLIARLREARTPGSARRERPRPAIAALRVLGRDTGELAGADGRSGTLSARHSELLALLSWHRDGLSAERLAELLYGDPGSTVTLRAEIVRLRRALAAIAPELGPLARPYRLAAPLETDLGAVLDLQRRGAHRAAIATYGGGPLPGSDAPGIDELREEVVSRLREALLESGSADLLIAWGETERGAADEDIWRAALHALPAHSPRRAQVVARLLALES